MQWNMYMETLRECLAIFIFMLAVALIYAVIDDFSWGSVLTSVGCFIIAYFIWPSKRRGQRNQENRFVDIIEIIIELPVEFFMWILRFIGRIFRNKDGNVDLDIDIGL